MRKHVLSLFVIILTLTGFPLFQSCGTARRTMAVKADVETLSERLWTFSQTHPDGFTVDVRTMAEPTEGISVAYAETQNSFSRESLLKVVSHALTHDGYVGGWKEDASGLYYFDSVRLFPEDSLRAALAFARENHQHAVFVLSTGEEIQL
jgi:hypothetical protein